METSKISVTKRSLSRWVQCIQKRKTIIYNVTPRYPFQKAKIQMNHNNTSYRFPSVYYTHVPSFWTTVLFTVRSRHRHHTGAGESVRSPCCDTLLIVVYYVTIKRELNKRLIYECRCDERRKDKDERSTLDPKLSFRSIQMLNIKKRNLIWDKHCRKSFKDYQSIFWFVSPFPSWVDILYLFSRIRRNPIVRGIHK